MNRNKIVQNLTTDSKISNSDNIDVDKVKINETVELLKKAFIPLEFGYFYNLDTTIKSNCN
jgi:hypothetical protein